MLDIRMQATDPLHSAWISAHAGSGKTQILVDRVLRLLLTGVMPERVLCITYTTAAAAEMTTRINACLSAWVTCDEGTLVQALSGLQGSAPLPHELKRARSLFAQVLDAPEGLRIQTIHSFCQMLLKRFPLEAATEPYFNVLDDRTADTFLAEAVQRFFQTVSEYGEETQAAVATLAARLSENAFRDLLSELVANKRKLAEIVTDKQEVYAAVQRIANTLGVNPERPPNWEDYFQYSAEEKTMLRQAAAALVGGATKADQKTHVALSAWLVCEDRAHTLGGYIDAWMTKGGKKRDKIFSINTLKDETLRAALLAEQERVARYAELASNAAIFVISRALLVVAQAILGLYENIKYQHAALDYEDLILRATELLHTSGVAPWVLFKLDGGIDHVLLDEAQDTSRAQWRIVQALTEEFFSGQGRAEQPRSLFVVGDYKQSIYRFQGAAPQEFETMQRYFKQKIEASGNVFCELRLTTSYRSTAPVLQLVDAVFPSQTPHQLSDKKAGDAGRVELWPLVRREEKEERAVWPMPVAYGSANKAQDALVEQLADTVAAWVGKRNLPSKGRPVQPGDIMILLKQRGALAAPIVRALKRRHIPVGGIDRLQLGESLVVKDLLALGHVLLQPQDNLSLAALLKSPLFDVTEEMLFTLAYGREKQSLWQRLKESTLPAAVSAYATLFAWMQQVDYLAPYELYAQVLRDGRARFVGRMGADVLDPIQEFLNEALHFERINAPSLQGFLHWFEHSTSEIKRDLEQAGSAVRVMTVHGAKGLQAPIVILPDTLSTPRASEKLLWEESALGNTVFWPQGEESASSKKLKDKRKAEDEAEYLRLLYVALTRAEDELYITGFTNEREPSEKSWYAVVRQALEGVATHDGEILRLEIPQTKRVEMSHTTAPQKSRAALPESLRHALPAEPNAARPLSPSALYEQGELQADSPLTARERYQHGRLVHLLLQHLPALQTDARESLGEHLLKAHASELDADKRSTLLQEVLGTIVSPALAPYFAAGSRAEVALAGEVELSGKKVAIAGQVDRIAILPDRVLLLDYKTNVNPPARAEDVPPYILKQMAAYTSLLQEIYPRHSIEAALFWTATGAFMPLPAALLGGLTLGERAPKYKVS